MTRYAVIDPATLGPMDALEAVDSEAILAARMLRVKEVWADYDPPSAAQYDVEELEFDSLKIDQEVDTNFEMLLRARINQAVRDTSLAFASGANLDAIASRYPGGVPRVETEVYADTDSPIDRIRKDDRYRRRIWLSPNAMAPNGVEEAYVFWALTGVPELRDASAVVDRLSPTREPRIVVSVMTGDPLDPKPTRQQLVDVRSYIHNEGRKGATDIVAVVAPGVVYVDLDVDLWLYPNASETLSLAAANEALDTLIESKRWLGDDHTHAAYLGALMQQGVQNAVIRSPAADVRVSPRSTVVVRSRKLTVRGRTS